MMLWAGDSDTDTDLGLPFHPCSVSMITLTHFHPINASVFPDIHLLSQLHSNHCLLWACGPPWGPIAHPQWVLTFPRCSLFTQQIQPWTRSSLTGIVNVFVSSGATISSTGHGGSCAVCQTSGGGHHSLNHYRQQWYTSFTRLTSLNIQSGEQLSSSAHPYWGWTVTTSSLLTGGYKSIQYPAMCVVVCVYISCLMYFTTFLQFSWFTSLQNSSFVLF